MAKKVFVGINNVIAKKNVLSIIVKMGIDFVEYYSQEDLKFKYDLLEDQIILMIHELSNATYNKDFELLKTYKKLNVKQLLIIQRYDAKVIDDAIDVGINDIIELPINEDVLKSKLLDLLSDTMRRVEEDRVFIDPSILDNEILRANRGKYSFSLVMAEFSGITEDEMDFYMDCLKSKLRETDLVLRYSEKRLLLICPFTIKEQIVEVENKLRVILKEKIMQFKNKVDLWIYGISYPKDGKTSEELLLILNDGLRSSIFLGSFKGSFYDMGKSEIEYYKKMIKKRN